MLKCSHTRPLTPDAPAQRMILRDIGMLALCVAWAVCGVLQAQITTGQESRLSTGVIAPGLASETAFFVREAAQAGPTVLIVGGMHGNEPAGAEAADQIRHWTIERGRLVVVPRANPPALDADVRRIPGKPREAGDLNRNFPATASQRGPLGPTAEHLWAFIQEIRPDWILDLHEGGDFHARNPRSVGSSIIHFDDEIHNPLVEKMLAAVNAEVEEEYKVFQSVPRGPVETGMVRATIHFLEGSGMVLETTRPDQPLSLRVRQHRMMVHALLSELDMVSTPAHRMLERREHLGEEADAPLRVALYEGPGAGQDGVDLLSAQLAQLDGIVHRRVSPADIRDGVLDQFDVVMFPGGRGGAQGDALGISGRTQVKAFVEQGGGYVGICAGAYLGTSRLESYLGLVPLKHRQPWQTGRGEVEIELTDLGQEILGTSGRTFAMRFANGPVFTAFDPVEAKVLARFSQAVMKDDTLQDFMQETPAIVASQHGMGRVLLISPHPESSENTSWIVEKALRWTGQREHTAAVP